MIKLIEVFIEILLYKFKYQRDNTYPILQNKPHLFNLKTIKILKIFIFYQI